RLGLFFSDRIKGASTVRILNQQAAQLAAFERASDEHNNRLAEVIRLAFLNTSVLDFFATVSMALVAVFIGFNLLGEVPFGFYGSPATLQSGLFILLLSPAFFAELKKLGKLYHVKSEATASADLWQHTLQWQQDNNRSANIDQPFHSLNLSDTTVLGLDGHALLSIGFCSLTKTDRVWLQGISGSGKSVVLDALAGLRDIKPGQCIINQRPAENLDELREQCFYLGQQSTVSRHRSLSF
ncbi:MAG: ABC transporter transmembrane domain-containing protein, partial [Reinekea sp.]